MTPFLAAVAVVARGGVYPDSKTFVDMPSSRGELQEAYEHVASCTGGAATQLRTVVQEYFDEAGSDLEDVLPGGWLPTCPDAHRCATPAGRKLAERVHKLWPHLSKTVRAQLAWCHPCQQHCYVHKRNACRYLHQNSDLLYSVKMIGGAHERSTLLPLPHPMIVAGSRFRELYYWDSFWTLKGLLASGMRDCALHMVQNFLHLVNQHGFVPNGSRTYYLNRSQPPLLAAMVDLVQRHPTTHPLPPELVPLCIECLKKEHAYWTKSPKQVLIQNSQQRTFALSRYYAEWQEPRPESFREDHTLAHGLVEESAQQLYRDLASAAESGWDFSSRWLADSQNLATIRTTKIVPVDLNTFLWNLEQVLSKLMAASGDADGAQQFGGNAAERARAMEELMWSPGQHRWNDLLLLPPPDSALNKGTETSVSECIQIDAVHACSWTPLLFGIPVPQNTNIESVITTMWDCGLVRPGGLATTLVNSTQQWDRSNSWPPLVAMWVDGLSAVGREHGSSSAVMLAETLAKTFLSSVTAGIVRTGFVWEKYCADSIGGAGSGGEYDAQIGFGWSIGTTLHFLLDLGINW